MAQYRTGPDTFQVVKDEGTQEVAAPKPSPPKQPIREPVHASGTRVDKPPTVVASFSVPQREEPQYTVVERKDSPAPPIGDYVDTSPVSELKRETADRYNYTPQAKRQLHDTPVQVDFTLDAPYRDSLSPGSTGYYLEPQYFDEGYDIRVNVPLAEDKAYPQYTLAHEFGHKQMFEMPYNEKRWNEQGQERVDPFVREQARRFYSPHAPDSVSPVEEYAVLAGHPYMLTQRERDEYFPGMFREWRRTPVPPTAPRNPEPVYYDRPGFMEPFNEEAYPPLEQARNSAIPWRKRNYVPTIASVDYDPRYDQYIADQQRANMPDDQIMQEDEFYQYIEFTGKEPPRG